MVLMNKERNKMYARGIEAKRFLPQLMKSLGGTINDINNGIGIDIISNTDMVYISINHFYEMLEYDLEEVLMNTEVWCEIVTPNTMMEHIIRGFSPDCGFEYRNR